MDYIMEVNKEVEDAVLSGSAISGDIKNKLERMLWKLGFDVYGKDELLDFSVTVCDDDGSEIRLTLDELLNGHKEGN